MMKEPIWTVTFFLLAVPHAAQAGTVWFFDDLDGFLEAAGNVQVIDFETLPDGSPSVAGTPITPDFNYTEQGVTFSTPIADLVERDLFIAGNIQSEFELATDSSPFNDRTWIIADLVVPVFAVGVNYPSISTFSLFDEKGALLDSQSFGRPDLPFLGVVSDVPIASTILNRGVTSQILLAYYFAPIPEPATSALLGLGVLTLWRRKTRLYPISLEVVV